MRFYRTCRSRGSSIREWDCWDHGTDARGALGSGLAIFTRYPIISAHALPYSLSGSPYQVIAGDFFVKKAAANVVISHPLLGQIEIWNTHVGCSNISNPDIRCMLRASQDQRPTKHIGWPKHGSYRMLFRRVLKEGGTY